MCLGIPGRVTDLTEITRTMALVRDTPPAVLLGDPGARPFLPRAGKHFVADPGSVAAQLRHGQSRDGTEYDDAGGTAGKDFGGCEGAGVQQDFRLRAAFGGR